MFDDSLAEFCEHQRHVGVSLLPFFFTILTEQLMASESSEMQRHYLELLRRSQQRRGFFISQERDWESTAAAPFYPPAQERKLEYLWVQLVTLLLMCSSDTEVCSRAMQCAYGHAQLTVGVTKYYDQLPDEWLRLYTDLADPNFLHTGRIAQQKRIRALLRDIEEPSVAGWLAWKEAYSRWANLTSSCQAHRRRFLNRTGQGRPVAQLCRLPLRLWRRLLCRFRAHHLGGRTERRTSPASVFRPQRAASYAHRTFRPGDGRSARVRLSLGARKGQGDAGVDLGPV